MIYRCLLTSLLAASSLLGLEPVLIQQNDAEELLLSWSGGEPPYVVQQSQDLTAWTDLGETTDQSFTILDRSAVQAFFRVQGASEPILGEPYGQWRIAQGEFGEALAKHRLKSIWEFFLPEDASVPTASAFFTTAMLRIQYLDGAVVKTFVGRLEDLPQAVISTGEKKISVTWTWGEDVWKRDLSLEMTFRYGIDAIRFNPVNLSDPTIRLRADYQTPKPNRDGSGKVTSITSEEATLVEVDESGNAPGWWQRKIQFTHAGVTIDSQFQIGVPLIEGGPAFIFKTPLLVSWAGTTVSGLTNAPIELKSRFAQTYYPFHHNFVETLWLEPRLEPGIDPAILEELEEKNIRFIVPQNPSAFPNQEPTLGVMGFDDVFRDF